jgi:hypothetical protein
LKLAKASASKPAQKETSRKDATGKAKVPVGKSKARAVSSGSKHESIVALLRKPDGATLNALVKATGWQRHSVRGFLAGTVRGKLKLPLVSEQVDGIRTYRIDAKQASVTTKTARRV